MRRRTAMPAMLAAMLVAASGTDLRAAPAADLAPDPALEARVKALSAELRCLVCQNQTIADSNAGLAVDLRNQVREQLRAGRSDTEIIDYMTARYGDFVRYRPPWRTGTLLLWAGPALLVGLGGWAWWRALARPRDDGAPPDDDEAREADALLAGPPRPGVRG